MRVVDSQGTVFRVTNAGVLEVFPDTHQLRAAQGPKGKDGGWAPHQHPLAIDAPTTYDEYFTRCVWPGFPAPAEVSGGTVDNAAGVPCEGQCRPR